MCRAENDRMEPECHMLQPEQATDLSAKQTFAVEAAVPASRELKPAFR